MAAGATSGHVWQTAKNVISSWGTMLVVAVLSFFLSPFIVHQLGNDAYGAWVLISSVVGYLGLLDLGVRSAVTTYVATLHAKGEHAEANHIASAALALFAGAGLLAIAAAVGFAEFGLGHFDISPELLSPARLVLHIGGVTVATALIGGVFGGIVVARQRFDLLNLMSLAHEIVRFGAIFLALWNDGGLIELAMIQLAIGVSQMVWTFGMSRRIYPELRPWRLDFKRVHLRIVLSFGFFTTWIHASTLIVNYTDSLVIGAYLPISMITFFAIAANLVEQCRNLAAGISRSISPVASALDVGSDRSNIARVLLSGARLATLVSLPIMVTFLLRGHSFIGLWMGEEYAEPAGDVLFLLAFGLWVSAGFHICVATMIGIKEHRGLIPAIVAEAACNAGLSIWLVQDYGIVGVAVGTLVPRVIMSVVVGPWYTRRVVGIPIAHYLDAIIVRPTLSVSLFALATWACERYFPAENLVVYFGQVALLCPLAVVGAWFLSLNTSERAYLLNFLKSNRPAA